MANRWQVFEYMKNHYLKYGKIPTADDLAQILPTTVDELIEGLHEFDKWHDSEIEKAMTHAG